MGGAASAFGWGNKAIFNVLGIVRPPSVEPPSQAVFGQSGEELLFIFEKLNGHLYLVTCDKVTPMPVIILSMETIL